MKLTKLLIFCVSSLLFSAVAFAQDVTVNGTINDESGLPVPGATVLVKGTNKATASDFDGKFQISAPSNGVLVISFVGFQTLNETINGRTKINAILTATSQNLNEVVVVGYGTQKKGLITGASTNLKGETIKELNTGSAMEALQGIAPGISITRTNGSPGAGTKVTIRGLGTNGNSNPLYIVDGISVGNIDYLSPSDIESIDILKDAASAAIYGSRAANGVVLVTTVKGKKGRAARISYDSYFGIQNIYKNLDPLNAQEYMYIIDEGRVNDGLPRQDWQKLLTNNSWLNTQFPGAGTQLGNEIWEKLQNGWTGTNWINEMSKKDAPIMNHSLNITGGSEDITYAFGVSYFQQDGIIGGDLVDAGFKRLTTRLNTQMVLKKNDSHSIITVGENVTYTNSQNRGVSNGNIYGNDLHNALTANPLQPAYWQTSIDRNIDKFGFTPTLDGISTGQTNPLAVMFYRSNYNYPKDNRITGNAFLEIEPIKDLKFRTVYGIDSWFGYGRSMNPTYNLGVLYQDYINGASQYSYIGANSTWTNTVSYKKQFGNHNVSAVAGTELIQYLVNNNVSGSRNNLTFGEDPRYAYLNNTAPKTINDIGTNGMDTSAGGGGIMSYFARAQYDYKEKYLLSATIRADGSSNFAEGKRWGYFPSVSAGWVITKEDFIESSSKWLNSLKVRGSWGQNGNQDIPNFYYSSNIAYVFPGYFFGDTKPVSGTTAYPARVTNPDLTWETSEQLDFGLDASLFDSRLNVTLDWYNKTTKDWLVLAAGRGTDGAAPPYFNGGDIENKGFEFSVNWSDKIGGFKYGATVSGAFNKNKVTRIANADGILHGPSNVLSQGTGEISRGQVGFPLGYFYGFKTAGILQNQQEVNEYVGPDGQPYFSDQRPGDVRFVDQNNDGIIDESDKVYLGNPNPDFELGIQLNFEYKNVYLNTTMAGKFGMQVMQSYRSFADSPAQNYTSDVFDRWHGEGTSTKMPRLSATSNRNSNYVSDIYMQNADYLRINNLTLGYNFNEVFKDFKFISNLKFYVAVNNLYTFTKYDGMDPEVRWSGDNTNAPWASGIDLGLYPQARTVMFGLSADF
ncbi:SusC/RagA family TonB-linked outer membrane protein [Flavobacterium sp. Root935]|uniref:SusC/RagA family TonB-linked outer membrane protein n=1 Tax=Flavobacterium sp. Root935 TaxID=1736610 RepID=UPI00070DD150|nr:TonB-dependent receptor [Flavobacterium sp. Root935]KRD59967.1 SusC/RagA family TonB-linked outer membrane protein [Flavobacterium sp. Root935]